MGKSTKIQKSTNRNKVQMKDEIWLQKIRNLHYFSKTYFNDCYPSEDCWLKVCTTSLKTCHLASNLLINWYHSFWFS